MTRTARESLLFWPKNASKSGESLLFWPKNASKSSSLYFSGSFLVETLRWEKFFRLFLDLKGDNIVFFMIIIYYISLRFVSNDRHAPRFEFRISHHTRTNEENFYY